jgi:gluconolactonase
MPHELLGQEDNNQISRRKLLSTLGAAVGVAAIAPRIAVGQTPGPATPPSTITTPARDFSPGESPVTYPDPDILILDPRFGQIRRFNTPILRLWTGALWSEGPAWSSQGRYLVWSDIPNNRQLRYVEDDGRVTVFRSPSNNSNGNTFDFEGRQLSCEHLTRRVVRYENDGSVVVIADSYNGTHLIGPNDVVPHPDGSYWFTDLGAGGQLYEGTPDAAGGPSNPDGRLNPRLGQPPEIGTLTRELPPNLYRVDPSGRVDLAVSAEQIGGGTNGLTFSPDYRKLYAVSGGVVHSFDVGDDNRCTNMQQFADFMVDGVMCRTDGIRCDVDGNLWCSANAGQSLGYSGVTVWSPEGELIGRIRLPEVCANVCFGGPERNRLFMVASQSLYAVYLSTQGAAPS